MISTQAGSLFCFGYGYTASSLAQRLRPRGWKIAGTLRNSDKAKQAHNVLDEVFLWPNQDNNNESKAWVFPAGITHVLLSIPPVNGQDIVYPAMIDALKKLPHLTWVGYLSTTGVYGDHLGEWVTEETPVNPPNTRTQARVQAEQSWLNSGLPTQVFRLSGIYGPGSSAFDALLDGTARRIDKPGQVFSRIHVEDIAQTLWASMQKPNPGRIYNLADDEPCPQHEVVAYAASLLGMAPPPLVAFDEADLSEMARSFYQSNRRVANKRMKEELGVDLAYPSYKDGLLAIYKQSTTPL
ncbi:MAG: SDR family oxidoreductase [Alphaproteobacteria bacterium]|nr:SDR family oxidoreductase [Alphaproteobacteria bacterium]